MIGLREIKMKILIIDITARTKEYLVRGMPFVFVLKFDKR